MKAILLFFLIMSGLFGFEGKVVRVSDGDTIVVLTQDKEQIKVRLNGIDAPEKKQSFGRQSTKFLSNLVVGRTVEVKKEGNDRYGRTIGTIILDGVELIKRWWLAATLGLLENTQKNILLTNPTQNTKK